ncbi:MAG TPA: hypothetical protein VMX35_00180 [Acidobacteriota bacterium]|nr:hypothetical protein [Acidobacteriota bacterium]
MVGILFAATVAIVVIAEWIAIRKRRSADIKVTAEPHELAGDGVLISDGLFYSPGHNWSALDAGGTLAVGADDLLLKLAGRIDDVILPEIGREVDKGEPLFALKMGRRSLSVPSPVKGTVEAVNHDVVGSPAMLSLIGAGWAVRVKPAALAEDLAGMSIGAQARILFESEIVRLRDFFAGLSLEFSGAGATLQDGGMPVEGVLARMDEESLRRFEKDFLEVS